MALVSMHNTEQQMVNILKTINRNTVLISTLMITHTTFLYFLLSLIYMQKHNSVPSPYRRSYLYYTRITKV